MFRFGFVLTTLLSALLITVRAGEPPPAAADAKEVASFLKASETAELHGIAVSAPAIHGFLGRPVKDWPKLFKALRDGKRAVARIREFLPERCRKLLDQKGIIEEISDSPDSPEARQMRSDFVGAIEEILDESELFDAEEFAGVALDDETKRLVGLGKKRTAHELSVMNWRLLAATFPGLFPDVPAGFRTIRVQVRDDKNVVLVLSCSMACHWQVDVKPGCKVTGVVLCGGRAQEVEFFENPVDAPVVYRSAHDPYGARRLKPGDEYFDGHELRGRPDKKFEVREKFEAGIKKLTGKCEFVSMQRETMPKKEPYIIPPKAK